MASDAGLPVEIVTWVCRFFGIISAILLWAVGAELAMGGNAFCVYSFIMAICLTTFELLFIIDYWSAAVRVTDSCRCGETAVLKAVVNFVRWMDVWRRALLYAIFTIPCFVFPARNWLLIIPGGFLLSTCLCLVVKTILIARQPPSSPSLQNQDQSYNRVQLGQEDEMSDEDADIDESLAVTIRATVTQQDHIYDM